VFASKKEKVMVVLRRNLGENAANERWASLVSTETAKVCPDCHTPQPNVQTGGTSGSSDSNDYENLQQRQEETQQQLSNRHSGDWECPCCHKNVFASKTACFSCGTPKPTGGGGGNYNTQGFDDEFATERVPVHPDSVGRIIGKGGQNIKSMQRNTNTKMSVVRPTANETRTTVEISGTWGNVQRAKAVLAEVGLRHAQFARENTRRQYPSISQTVVHAYIKSSAVNLFNGHNGQTTNNIQIHTSTKIKVDQAEDITDVQHAGFRRIVIVGKTGDVANAQKAVDDFFREYPAAAFPIGDTWITRVSGDTLGSMEGHSGHSGHSQSLHDGSCSVDITEDDICSY
jgi:predicted RNA-binding protein YlqC (UPF0109 family)